MTTAVTGGGLERLRAEASRDDYASMARLATALYKRGSGPRETLQQCYGVAFPEEFFVLAEAGPATLDLLAIFTNQPWKLAVPPARGDPPPAADLMEDTERRIFAREPDLVPLLHTLMSTVGREPLVLCYRLTELAAGRSTVFHIEQRAEPRDEIVRRGDSLLAFLHEHHAAHLRGLRWELEQPSNRGAGSVSGEDVSDARSSVERIEELRRRVAERAAG